MQNLSDAIRAIDHPQIQTQIAARIGWDGGRRNGKVCVVNDYERIARVIRFLDEHHTEQPTLETLAEQAGLSSFHFHRLFASWAGVTPKDFIQCLTFSHARDLLRRGESVMNVALDAGLSGPGRLHDLCVNLEAASPGEIKSNGANLLITAGFTDTPFGNCLIGETPRGICHLSFIEIKSREAATAELRRDWPNARVRWDDSAAARLAAIAFKPQGDEGKPQSLRAFVRGTAFQLRVWRALLQVPAGAVTSYSRLAETIDHPQAARAVGSAVGQNRLAFLIPCHRVIRETGVLGNYRWGETRKRAMLLWESSRSSSRPTSIRTSLRDSRTVAVESQ